MRNFIRVLRMSWAYKTRLILSVIAATIVAVFWSINISSVYPVMKILGNENLHIWVETEIAAYEKKASDPDRRKYIEYNREIIKRNELDPNLPDRENVVRRAYEDLSKLEREQHEADKRVFRYRLLKTQVIRYLPESQFQQFLWIILALVIGTTIKGIFEFSQESHVGHVVQRTVFDLRNRFFRKSIHQDMKQLGEVGTTDLMTRLTNDSEQLGNGMKMLYGRVVLEPLRIFGCIIGACIISWQLTLMFAGVVLIAVFVLNKVSRSIKKAARRVLDRMASLYKVLREVFDGLRIVKSFSRESHERRRFRTATYDYYKRSMKVINIDAAVSPILETLGVAAVSLALIAGGYLVIEKKTHIFGVRMIDELIGIDALITMGVFLAAIADPVRKLSSVYTKMQTSMAAADRVFALYDREPSILPNAEGPRIPLHSKEIVFKDVCFSYVPGQSTLNEINLTVRAGETVALVGPNGCGKSTLLGLVARFYDPDFGSITVDGVPIRTANLRSLRKQIGIVTQDTVMFDDSILNNIAYGKPNATSEEVEAAAKQAHAHEFIITMPEGYQTRTGDMAASKLSGGQKQRIALARAVLRDPRILILDEFTSQIDGESEAKIHDTLKTFIRNRTTFLITHRLSTLELADRIVVMDAGKIVAIGHHDDLFAKCETYRRLYESQSLSANELFNRNVA